MGILKLRFERATVSKMKNRLRILSVSLLLVCFHLHAQPQEKSIKIIVAPDHTDWTYKAGEAVTFKITVLKDGNNLKNVFIRYEIGPEQLDPVKKDSVNLPAGTYTVSGGTLNGPGFLRCVAVVKVEGKEYRGLATAGFDPGAIKPTVTNPSDFASFWETAKSELAKIPMDARMTLMPERCTENVNVYHVNLQNYRLGARLYGILCVPKKEGKYPALLKVPGAGIRPYAGDVATAEKGIITFEIGIHGIPVNLDVSVCTTTLVPAH